MKQQHLLSYHQISYLCLCIKGDFYSFSFSQNGHSEYGGVQYKLPQNVTKFTSVYLRIIPHTFLCAYIINKGSNQENRPPLWSSGQSFWLQIQRSMFESRRYQMFQEVVGLERGPLRLVSTIEELLGKNISGSSLESREHSRRDQSR
jgi:hypothetical protein